MGRGITPSLSSLSLSSLIARGDRPPIRVMICGHVHCAKSSMINTADTVQRVGQDHGAAVRGEGDGSLPPFVNFPLVMALRSDAPLLLPSLLRSHRYTHSRRHSLILRYLSPFPNAALHSLPPVHHSLPPAHTTRSHSQRHASATLFFLVRVRCMPTRLQVHDGTGPRCRGRRNGRRRPSGYDKANSRLR